MSQNLVYPNTRKSKFEKLLQIEFPQTDSRTLEGEGKQGNLQLVRSMAPCDLCRTLLGLEQQKLDR